MFEQCSQTLGLIFGWSYGEPGVELYDTHGSIHMGPFQLGCSMIPKYILHFVLAFVLLLFNVNVRGLLAANWFVFKRIYPYLVKKDILYLCKIFFFSSSSVRK